MIIVADVNFVGKCYLLLPSRRLPSIIMLKTVRQTITALLEEEALSTLDLAEILGLKEKEVAEHMEHVARSVSAPRKLKVQPAKCRKCGFTFTKKKQFKTPSRCPQCRSELVEGARFAIRQ